MFVIKKWLAKSVLIIALCLFCYLLGRSHSEVKIIKEQGQEVVKQVEIIKYVERKKAEIWSKPDANRADLLKLMHNDRL